MHLFLCILIATWRIQTALTGWIETYSLSGLECDGAMSVGRLLIQCIGVCIDSGSHLRGLGARQFPGEKRSSIKKFAYAHQHMRVCTVAVFVVERAAMAMWPPWVFQGKEGPLASFEIARTLILA